MNKDDLCDECKARYKAADEVLHKWGTFKSVKICMACFKKIYHLDRAVEGDIDVTVIDTVGPRVVR